MALTIKNDDGKKTKLQTGFRFKGNATSHYAEAIALEAMLYVGWRISESAADVNIK
eukprot:gene9808-24169_t